MLRDFNPMVKFTLAFLGLGLATILGKVYINLIILGLMLYLTLYVARIPWTSYLKAFSIPCGFLILSLLPMVLTFSQTNDFIWAIKLGENYLGIGSWALRDMGRLAVKVLAAISSSFFLVFTTPLNDLIRILKRLKVPNVFIELMVLTYRFIFLFLKEARDIFIAQELKYGYRDWKRSLLSLGLLIKSLFLRLLIRQGEVGAYLATKLYKGEFKIGD